jgi:type I site-specific restriction-modification system R (restriction) subunit
MEGFATIPDLVVYINGLPISAVECKSPKHQLLGIQLTEI